MPAALASQQHAVAGCRVAASIVISAAHRAVPRSTLFVRRVVGCISAAEAGCRRGTNKLQPGKFVDRRRRRPAVAGNLAPLSGEIAPVGARTTPPLAWAGITQAAAKRAGEDVFTGASQRRSSGHAGRSRLMLGTVPTQRPRMIDGS